MTLLTLLVIIYFSIAVMAETHKDLIKTLPGWEAELDEKQYSGYLKVSEDKFLHYWFVESKRSPADDPLLLWLNGGPGCSSLLGYLSELGPYFVNKDGKTLFKNAYSWNKVANIIFLESPAGVGFSYSVSKNITADDDTVAQDNYVALQHFFEKFPRFKKNEFYITGESYAGIYVPMLSVKVLDGKTAINFKGFAIGNGCVDNKLVGDSFYFFAYYHGLLGDEDWESLADHCCKGTPSNRNCNFDLKKKHTKECNKALKKAEELARNANLNTYNIYTKCENTTETSSRYMIDKYNLISRHTVPIEEGSEEELVETTKDKDSQILKGTACMNSTHFETYLSQKSVQEALHISGKIKKWYNCHPTLHQHHYTKIRKFMRPQVKKLLRSGKLRGMIYAGDVDMACNFLGQHWFANSLNLPIVKAYRTWEYEKQIAGWVIDYKNFTFLTVKGSGHMVPTDKPGPALKIITNFLRNKPL